MNAALDPTAMETETTPNRMSGYFAAAQARPQLPKTDQERHAVLTDCVMAAIIAMRELLYCGDPQIVMMAADKILDVERTRIRHDRNVSGCKPPLQKIDFDELNQGMMPQSQRAHAAPASDSAAMQSLGADGIEGMFKNLEKLFGINDDDDEMEEEVAPPPAKPAPAYAKSEDEALAWHAAEMRSCMSKAAKMEPGSSLREISETEAMTIVRDHLKKWQFAATAIPKGGFWRAIAERTEK
jgi:hypothetical protein